MTMAMMEDNWSYSVRKKCYVCCGDLMTCMYAIQLLNAFLFFLNAVKGAIFKLENFHSEIFVVFQKRLAVSAPVWSCARWLRVVQAAGGKKEPK